MSIRIERNTRDNHGHRERIIKIVFDCVNLDCPRVSKMLRCGLCRRRKDYICAACGISVNTNIKIYCEECAKFSKLEWAKEYQTTYRCKHRIRIRIQ